MAAERGAMVDSSEDSMATCFLLEMLEERREGKAGRAYGSAFVSHLRALLDRQEEEGSPMVMNQSLGWSSLIVSFFLFFSGSFSSAASLDGHEMDT